MDHWRCLFQLPAPSRTHLSGSWVLWTGKFGKHVMMESSWPVWAWSQLYATLLRKKHFPVSSGNNLCCGLCSLTLRNFRLLCNFPIYAMDDCKLTPSISPFLLQTEHSSLSPSSYTTCSHPQTMLSGTVLDLLQCWLLFFLGGALTPVTDAASPVLCRGSSHFLQAAGYTFTT